MYHSNVHIIIPTCIYPENQPSIHKVIIKFLMTLRATTLCAMLHVHTITIVIITIVLIF